MTRRILIGICYASSFPLRNFSFLAVGIRVPVEPSNSSASLNVKVSISFSLFSLWSFIDLSEINFLQSRYKKKTKKKLWKSFDGNDDWLSPLRVGRCFPKRKIAVVTPSGYFKASIASSQNWLHGRRRLRQPRKKTWQKWLGEEKKKQPYSENRLRPDSNTNLYSYPKPCHRQSVIEHPPKLKGAFSAREEGLADQEIHCVRSKASHLTV